MKRALVVVFCLVAIDQAAAAQQSFPFTAMAKAKPLSVDTAEMLVDCAWPPGTQIWWPSVSGGDGNPITWTMTIGSGFNATDLVISASTGIISIGPNGIAPADCGKLIPFTVAPTQQ